MVGPSPLARIGSPPSPRLGAPYLLGFAPGTRLDSAFGATSVFNLPRLCSSGEPQLLAGHLVARDYMVVVSPRPSEEACAARQSTARVLTASQAIVGAGGGS